MSQTLKVISPIDGSIYYECEKHTEKEIDAALVSATKAQKEWNELSIFRQFYVFHKWEERVDTIVYSYYNSNTSAFQVKRIVYYS